MNKTYSPQLPQVIALTFYKSSEEDKSNHYNK